MTGLVICQTIESTVPHDMTLREWRLRHRTRRLSLRCRLWIRFGGVV